MTESEWLGCPDPLKMLTSLRGRVTDRKVRLFLVACARAAWDRLEGDGLRRAVEAAEQAADGLVTPDCLQEHNGALFRYALSDDPDVRAWVFGPAERRSAYNLALATTFSGTGLDRVMRTSAYHSGLLLTGPSQPALLRDIFGPLPGRCMQPCEGWRSQDVTKLAAEI